MGSASRSSRPASCAGRACGRDADVEPPPMIGTTTPDEGRRGGCRGRSSATATRSRWRRGGSASLAEFGYRHPEFAARRPAPRRRRAGSPTSSPAGQSDKREVGSFARQGETRGAPRDAPTADETGEAHAEAGAGVGRSSDRCSLRRRRTPTIPSALGVTCTVAADDVRECGSTTSAQHLSELGRHADRRQHRLPAGPRQRTDGNYPLIIVGHGYGGSKIGFGASGSTSGLRQFTSRGYAVFSMTDRGFHESCGSAASITAGGSALRQRLHPPDGRSLRGPGRPVLRRRARRRGPRRRPASRGDRRLLRRRPLAAARHAQGPRDDAGRQPGPLDEPGARHCRCESPAATPNIPWSDLAYSLTPNGGKLDYVADPAYTGRMGIEKESFNNGLYAVVDAGRRALLRRRRRTPRPAPTSRPT